jgi:ferric-dicitrate binding protein FerR (iron transport regulator)
MGPLNLLIHFANFAAPAVFLAALLPILARALMPKRAPPRRQWAWVAINLVAGLAVLGAGLWWFGHDGKMATYAALVLVMGSGQWLASGAWK